MKLNKSKFNYEDNQNSLDWMVSFSDVVTLLITFFVLIISMSSMNYKSIGKSFEYLSGTPQIMLNNEEGSKYLTNLLKENDLNQSDLQQLLEIMTQHKLKETEAINILKLEKILGKNYKISDNDIVVELDTNTIFDYLNLQLTSVGSNHLIKIKDILPLYKKECRIETFASDFPINTRKIKDNFDYTLKINKSIYDFLLNNGVKKDRIEIMAWGNMRIKKNITKITFKGFLEIEESSKS